MIKIVIIDDEINHSFLQFPEKLVKVYSSKKSSINRKNCMTHGTLCAKILENNAPDLSYELYNFDVIRNGKNNIKKLASALRKCIKMDFDIICMSIGTVCLSNSNLLEPLLKKLSEKAILIAALSNKGYFTIPASLPYVIGVAAFNNEEFLKTEIIYKVPDNSLGIDFITGYKKADFYDVIYCRGNSLVVPVLAARCATLVEKTKFHDTMRIKNILKKECDFFQVSDKDILFEKRTQYIPNIFVSTKIGITESYLLKVLSLVSKKCFCEGTIWTDKTISDLRVVTFSDKDTKKFFHSDYRILFESNFKNDNCILYVIEKNNKIIIYDLPNKVKYYVDDLSVKRLAHIIMQCLETVGNTASLQESCVSK